MCSSFHARPVTTSLVGKMTEQLVTNILLGAILLVLIIGAVRR